MTPKRRRWLAALGIFLATALGGVVAYLLARRRRQVQPAPEDAAVSELAARLRREAAAQEERLRRHPAVRLFGRRARHHLPQDAALPVFIGTDNAATPSCPAADDTAAGSVRDDAGPDGSGATL